ncbi:MAG: peptide ABC transporter substrate-binding protein [Deltaproteobacteria bacterium]|nr:peptide ABC transporter substrate-binding protein [Deltaproteobacteria bacterium]
MNMLFSLTFALLSALPPAQTSKDEFVFNNRGEPESIDPHFATGVPDNSVIAQIFQGLMARKADWATLVPGDAESYKISKDLKTYTFKIRKGLKWSDGTPLTAKDYEYSWLRVLRPETLSNYSYWLTDNVVGALAYQEKPTPENAAKVGIKAIDNETFVVTLNKPVPYFLHLTAETILAPVKKEVVEKWGSQWTRPENIVSNGPYKLSSWKVQDRIVMDKNPLFHDAANVKLQRVVALPIEDRQTGVNMYQQGKLDWSGHNGAPNSLVPAFKANPDFRIFPGFISYYYLFNTKRPPLDNPKVREAMVLTIDRDELVKQVTRGGEIGYGALVPPHTGTYGGAQGLPSKDFKADVAKAKKLLAEAGFPEGKGFRTLNLLYNTDENHKKVALALSQMWKKNLGITVAPFNQEWKVYLKSQNAKDFDLSRQGWQGDYPDPATFLELFQSKSGNNHTGWASAEYDKKFQETNNMPAGKARDAKLKEVEELLLKDAPIAPIFIYTNFGFLRPEVVGFEENSIDRPYVRYFSKK